jgi:RNA polymerase sigma factor (sigma-70 family)
MSQSSTATRSCSSSARPAATAPCPATTREDTPSMRDDSLVIDLVARARHGDQQAWNVLMERYAPLVWSICRRYRMNEADAHDIGQSVWLQLLGKLDKIRDPAALPGWLTTTTQRQCARALRTTRGPRSRSATGCTIHPRRPGGGGRRPVALLPEADRPAHRGPAAAPGSLGRSVRLPASAAIASTPPGCPPSRPGPRLWTIPSPGPPKAQACPKPPFQPDPKVIPGPPRCPAGTGTTTSHPATPVTQPKEPPR